ncbi:DNA repair protein RadC [Proteiniclasticum sp. C24MP]|uniref:RadC family protein n=1 Tax=Proteiniclasticum sp. C24MP TaxID=3374101 RepID=UPI00375408F8
MNYSNLTDKELLQIVINERSSESIAEALLDQYQSLPGVLMESSEEELLTIRGLGIKKIQRLKAIQELSRRVFVKGNPEGYMIKGPEDIGALMIPMMRFLKEEHLKVLLLNTKNKVISIETASIGSLNASIVSPREIFKLAIRKSAASIVLVHNHPSGETMPSQEDISATARIKECGKILGITLLDHVIIGDIYHYSLRENGFL